MKFLPLFCLLLTSCEAPTIDGAGLFVGQIITGPVEVIKALHKPTPP